MFFFTLGRTHDISNYPKLWCMTSKAFFHTKSFCTTFSSLLDCKLPIRHMHCQKIWSFLFHSLFFFLFRVICYDWNLLFWINSKIRKFGNSKSENVEIRKSYRIKFYTFFIDLVRSCCKHLCAPSSFIDKSCIYLLLSTFCILAFYYLQCTMFFYMYLYE